MNSKCMSKVAICSLIGRTGDELEHWRRSFVVAGKRKRKRSETNYFWYI